MGRRWIGWAWLMAITGCQPALVVDDGGGSGTSATTTTPDDPSADGPLGSSTTSPSADVTTRDPTDPTTADDTSTGSGPIPETCDTLAQDCPPGYKCTIVPDPELRTPYVTRCVEVADDPVPPLEPCSVSTWPPDGHDDCDATSFCFDIDPRTLVGQCAPFCVGTPADAHCTDPCQYCQESGDGVLRLCRPTCDPLADACPEAQACYPTPGLDVFECFDEYESLGVGDPCDFVNVCASGTACISEPLVPGCMGGAMGCCSPYCNPAAAFDPCPAILPGTECMAWYPPGDEPLPGCGVDPPGICAAP